MAGAYNALRRKDIIRDYIKGLDKFKNPDYIAPPEALEDVSSFEGLGEAPEMPRRRMERISDPGQDKSIDKVNFDSNKNIIDERLTTDDLSKKRYKPDFSDMEGVEDKARKALSEESTEMERIEKEIEENLSMQRYLDERDSLEEGMDEDSEASNILRKTFEEKEKDKKNRRYWQEMIEKSLGGVGAFFSQDETLTDLGLGLAGIGDALSGAHGGKTDYLGNILTLDLKEKDLARKLKDDASGKRALDTILKTHQIQSLVSKEADRTAKVDKITNLEKRDSKESRSEQERAYHNLEARWAIRNNKESQFYKNPLAFEKWLRNQPGRGATDKIGLNERLTKEFKMQNDRFGKKLEGEAKISATRRKDINTTAKEKRARYSKDIGNFRTWVKQKKMTEQGEAWRSVEKIMGDYAFAAGYTATPSWDWDKLKDYKDASGKLVMTYDGRDFDFPRETVLGTYFKGFQGATTATLNANVELLFNAMISAQAGSNVTGNELKRQMDTFGKGLFSSNADYFGQLKRLKSKSFKAYKVDLEASFSTEFLEMYKKDKGDEALTGDQYLTPYKVEEVDLKDHIKDHYPILLKRLVKKQRRSGSARTKKASDEEVTSLVLEALMNRLKKMSNWKTNAQRLKIQELLRN